MKPTSWWPIAIIGALSSIGVLNTTLFVLAKQSRVSFITESPYEDALAYDARQQDESRSLTRGAEPVLVVEQRDGQSLIQLTFADNIRPTEASVQFLRPSGDDTDRQIGLHVSSDQRFSASSTPALKRGLWITDTRYVWEGETYRIRGEYVIP